jgi:hypothetical protein
MEVGHLESLAAQRITACLESAADKLHILALIGADGDQVRENVLDGTMIKANRHYSGESMRERLLRSLTAAVIRGTLPTCSRCAATRQDGCWSSTVFSWLNSKKTSICAGLSSDKMQHTISFQILVVALTLQHL